MGIFTDNLCACPYCWGYPCTCNKVQAVKVDIGSKIECSKEMMESITTDIKVLELFNLNVKQLRFSFGCEWYSIYFGEKTSDRESVMWF